jgi:hypothetical protein
MQPSKVLRSRARCCVVQTELQYTTSHVSGKGELSRGARRRKRKACLRSVHSSKVLPGMQLGVLLGGGGGVRCCRLVPPHVVALLPQRGQRVWAHNLMSGHSQRERDG